MKNNYRLAVVYDHRREASQCGKGSVHIQIYQNKKRKFFSTGVRVAPCEWSNEFWVTGRKDASVLNAQIEKTRQKILNEIRLTYAATEIEDLPTSEILKLNFGETSFLDWLAKEIKTAEVAIGTRKHYETTYRALEDFGKIKTFAQVTPQKVNSFLDFIKKRGVSVGCVRNYYKVLAKWVRVAQEQRKVSTNALLGVHCRRENASRRTRLLDAELKAIENAPLNSPYLERARDLFLIQCATGLAYSDLMDANFSAIQDFGELHALQGYRKKTGSSYFCVILPFGFELIEKYNFHLPKISNVKYNAFLKTIAQIANIDKNITTHVGRHTYACLCLSRGVRIEVVQKTLGHKDIATTQIYAKLVNQDVVNAFSDSVFFDTEKRKKSNCK